MKPLKIIHCVVFFLPVRIGGIEIYVKTLVKHLLAFGHDVKILVPQYPNELQYENEIEGIPVLTYPEALNTKRKEFSGQAYGKGMPGFIHHLQKEKPDIVHFHQLTSSNGVSLHHIREVKRRGIKVVFTNHLAGLTCSTGTLLRNGGQICNGKTGYLKCIGCMTTNKNKEISQNKFAAIVSSSSAKSLYSHWNVVRLKRQKAKELLQLCDRFFVLTNWYFESLKQNALSVGQVCVVRQALTHHLPNDKIKSDVEFKSEKIKAVFIGRLYPEKGLHVLLEAMQILGCSKISLDIYGQKDGEQYYAHCRELANGLHNITWKGVINNEEIIAALAGYDVLIIPSLIAEMSPLIVQESFAAKVPILGTNIGGLAEEIKNGEWGLLFSPNAKDLATCLSKIIEQPRLLSQYASKLPQPRSFESLARQVETEYYSIAK